MADQMTQEQAPEQAPDQNRESDGAETALLPSSMFGSDCAVGDTYSIKVVGKFDDQVEVEHVPEKKEEADEGSMAQADKSMEAMSQPGEGY